MSLTLIAGRSVKMSKYFCLRFKITFWYSLSSELRTEKWLITPQWRRVSQKTPRDKVHYMNIHGVVLSSWLFIKNSTDVFSTHPLTSSDISFKPGHVHIVCYHQSYWNFSNFQHQCCVWQGLTKKKVKKTKPQASKPSDLSRWLPAYHPLQLKLGLKVKRRGPYMWQLKYLWPSDIMKLPKFRYRFGDRMDCWILT